MGAIDLSPLQQTIKGAILEWNNDKSLLPLMNDVNQLSYVIERAVHYHLQREIGRVIRRSGTPEDAFDGVPHA